MGNRHLGNPPSLNIYESMNYECLFGAALCGGPKVWAQETHLVHHGLTYLTAKFTGVLQARGNGTTVMQEFKRLWIMSECSGCQNSHILTKINRSQKPGN